MVGLGSKILVMMHVQTTLISSGFYIQSIFLALLGKLEANLNKQQVQFETILE